MATVSIKATRAMQGNGVNLDGPTLVNQSTSNTYTVTDYNRFSVYTVATTVGTISMSGATITLTMPTTSATQLRLTVTKDGAASTFIVAIGATAIVTPEITSPSAGATNVNLSPTITATAFTTAPVNATTHASSQWQVATNNTFTAIVYDSGVTTVNKTSIQIPSNTLNIGTVYYVRVRYTGATIGTSAWSTTVSFTTTSVYVATPTLTMSDNVNSAGETPTLIGSTFNVVNGSDTHSATDWQVVRVSNSTVVWQSLGNTTDKTTIKVPAGILLVNTAYRARVRYAGAQSGYSAWAELNFTTANAFSFGQYLTVRGNAYKNGSPVVNPSGLLTFGRTLNQYTHIPSTPMESPYSTPNDGVTTSAASIIRGSVVYRPDGLYMVSVPPTGSGRIRSATVYKRSGDNFERLSLPITPDSNVVNYARWLNNSILLIASGDTIHVYFQQDDNFVKISSAPNNHFYQFTR